MPSIREAVKLLKIKEESIHYLINQGMLKAVEQDGQLIVMIDSLESYKELERRLRYNRGKYSVYIQKRSEDFIDHVETHPYAVVVGRTKTENGGDSPYVFLAKQNRSDWQDLVDPWIRHNSGERPGIHLEPLWL